MRHKSDKNDKDTGENNADINKTFTYHVQDHLGDSNQGNRMQKRPDILMDTPIPMDIGDYPQDADPVLINQPKVIVNGIHELKKRSVDPDREPSSRTPLITEMHFTQINQSISKQYCMNDQCKSQVGGDYNYLVRLSPYFPSDAHVTIEFIVVDGLSVSFCPVQHSEADWRLCGDYAGQASLVTRLPTPAGHHDWDLPVGQYFSSTYKFRVTYTAQTAETDACRLADQEMGQTFAEYTLFFKRVCDRE
jgi:hypothetical protein